MPTGAILYVQVPDSTTSEDWERWREAFVVSFDLELDSYRADIGGERFAELLAPDWRFLSYPTLGKDSIWDVFPQSVFLEVNLGDSYYGPGYERGYLPDFIEHAEWFEANIPESRVWYVNDCSQAAIVFDAPARAILLEYYQRVGSQPYHIPREEKVQWQAAQAECWRLWMLEQERVLREVRKSDGLQ
jgi:hypothetical protein